MRSYRIAVGAAGVVLLLTVASLFVGAPQPCGGLDDGYPPILAFELARTGADLRALFGAAPGPCRTALIDAFDTVNYVDLALFIPAYGTFLLAFFVGVRERGAALARAGLGFTVAAMLFDVLENVCLLALTRDLDGGARWLAILPWVTGVKWLALGDAGLVGGLLLARGGGRFARVGAVLCMAAPFVTLAAIVQPAQFGPYIALGVGASWLAFLVTAVAGARRP